MAALEASKRQVIITCNLIYYLEWYYNSHVRFRSAIFSLSRYLLEGWIVIAITGFDCTIVLPERYGVLIEKWWARCEWRARCVEPRILVKILLCGLHFRFRPSSVPIPAHSVIPLSLALPRMPYFPTHPRLSFFIRMPCIFLDCIRAITGIISLLC